jgi:hypothetical protein
MALALETLRSNQSLDFGSLRVVFLTLAGDGSADNIFTDIVLLVEAEESANLGGTLGSEALGVDHVGKPGDVTFSLLNDAKSENREIETGDSSSNALALPLSSTAWAVAAIKRDVRLWSFYQLVAEDEITCGHR